jgi:hypothetical protein
VSSQLRQGLEVGGDALGGDIEEVLFNQALGIDDEKKSARIIGSSLTTEARDGRGVPIISIADDESVPSKSERPISAVDDVDDFFAQLEREAKL